MATIAKDNGVLTFINVFTVEPEKQQELVTLLTEVAEQTMKQMAGFVSATVHRSFDGKRVVVYGQWESMAALEGMRKNPQAIARMQAAAAMAQFDPILCEVADVVSIR